MHLTNQKIRRQETVPGGRTERIILKLTKRERHELEEAAKAIEVSRTRFVNQALQAYLEILQLALYSRGTAQTTENGPKAR